LSPRKTRYTLLHRKKEFRCRDHSREERTPRTQAAGPEAVHQGGHAWPGVSRTLHRRGGKKKSGGTRALETQRFGDFAMIGSRKPVDRLCRGDEFLEFFSHETRYVLDGKECPNARLDQPISSNERRKSPSAAKIL